MHDDPLLFRPIGVIRSPHVELEQIPIQPVFSRDIQGRVIVQPEFADGLDGLEGFSHIFLFYCFHRSGKVRLRLRPYLSDRELGVFATRAPHRPNRLGMSLVRLTKIEGNILYVKDIDILDGTPLIDIKPYVTRFDTRMEVRSGWQEEVSDGEAAVRGIRDWGKKTPGGKDENAV